MTLFFFVFFVPSPEAPCQFDVPGLACGEKIYLIYIYMSILFFAESQRRKRIHTKDYCLILQRHSQFGKIALHLLFGWSLDKDKKVWINPNNSHESLDRSKLRPSQTPTIHPSEFFGHITFSVPNIKL